METRKVDTSAVPEKKYFRIGEVTALVGVDAHVLRYWETEFKIIKPYRGRSKQRLYRRQDVQNLLCIRNLLYEEKYTIAGARQFLQNKPAVMEVVDKTTAGSVESENDLLPYIKKELRDILEQLHGCQK